MILTLTDPVTILYVGHQTICTWIKVRTKVAIGGSDLPRRLAERANRGGAPQSVAKGRPAASGRPFALRRQLPPRLLTGLATSR